MSKMSDNINVGIYVRVSTEDQKDHGYSIPQQIDVLKNLACNNGWCVYKIYNDAGISGKNTQNRPGLLELIEDVKNKLISKVLITKLDRLSRNVVDTETLLNIFNSFNCELIDSTGKVIESNNPGGWLFTIMQSVFGQYERKTIISRVKDGFAGKVKQGKSLCSFTPPYGYDRFKGNPILTINDYEASVVKRIYNLYVQGYSFTEISRLLNSENISTKLNGRTVKRTDNHGNTIMKEIKTRWMPKTIRLILSNSTYIGMVRYHVNKKDFKEYNGLHKPIISNSLYYSVQQKLVNNRKISRTKRPKEDVYYCGLLMCGICNQKMVPKRTVKNKQNGNKVTYFGYRCINRENGECTSKGISQNKIEELFMQYIERIEPLKMIEKTDKLILNDAQKDECNKLSKIINSLQMKKNETMNLFIDNKIDKLQFEYINKELNDRINVLKKRVQNFQNQMIYERDINLHNISLEVVKHWKLLTNREKMMFLNEFVEYIVITNSNKLCNLLFEVKLKD